MCLICGGKVEDGAATRSDGVAFHCAKHGAYSVARTALPRFMKLDFAAQAQALERAKIFAPQRHGETVITTMDL